MFGFARMGLGMGALAAPLSAQITGHLEILSLESQIFGNQRRIRVWLPPGYSTIGNRQHYPVLYLNDGQNVFDATTSTFNPREWQVDEAASHLMREGVIEPLILVGIDNAGKADRSREYLPYADKFLSPPERDPQGRRYGEFLQKEVLPFVNARYRTLTGPDHTALGGSSYGALIALYAALTTPNLAGRVLLESPSLYVDEGHIFRDVEASEITLTRVYLGVGTNELNRPDCQVTDENREPVDDVRRMAALLRSRGMPPSSIRVTIKSCAIHDEAAWARRFPDALRFLFGRP